MRFLLWPMCYSELCCSISKLSYWFLVQLYCGLSAATCSFYSLTLGFVAQNVPYPDDHVRPRRMCILLSLKPLMGPDDICLIDGAVEFNYFITDFLPTWSINYRRRRVEASDDNSGVFRLSWQFYWILDDIFWCSIVRYIYIKSCSVFFGFEYFIWFNFLSSQHINFTSFKNVLVFSLEFSICISV